ncbi:MAG TPA: VIT domain-containing protein [Pseudomonadota bacterium]|nr:VIT domain-containing protein [Pseudomonadota bacterium]
MTTKPSSVRVGSWRAALIFAFGCVLWLGPGCGPRFEGHQTVATVEVIRTPVELKGAVLNHAIAGDERLSAGQKLVVAERAQALLRHDQGARLLLDSGATAEVTDDGVSLTSGRLWVDAREGGRIEVATRDLSAVAGGAGYEVSVSDSGSQVTVVRGEVAFISGKGRGVAHAGELINASGGNVVVKPVVLWDDWTGGLGWPDPRKSRGAAGIGEVGARRPGNLGEARFPLSIQRLQVRTRIDDDLAVTTVEETFFNPAESTLEGIFRVHLPEGAILSRFAIDRRGRFVDGYVKERETAQRDYQAQVYEGSTKDPALLEWEAPGSYKARLYPLPPGSSRRVLYTYSEWLTPHGEGFAQRAYRFPMAGSAGGGAPLIQELDIEVDAGSAGAKEVRSGLGALISKDGRRVVLQRTDYVPSADLLVEMIGLPRPAEVARVYRATHSVPSRPGARSVRDESDYVLIRAMPVAAPKPSSPTPLDLVLLVDISAATDATHLSMARTLIESVLRHLGPQDRVALLGADLNAHSLLAPSGGKAGAGGKPGVALTPATAEAVPQLLAQLGATRTGGATDLGAALSQAAALLQPDRAGAVLYVGDAQPTVGELDLPSLRERLERLPAPLRLYGVGIGAEANLNLLSGLCQMNAGLAFRVSDRAAAAETAVSITTHLSRPAVSRIKVEVGSGLDRVYPRQSVSLRAGEPLFILARLRQSVPQTVQVEGLADGQPFKTTFKLETHNLDDTADLRLRWSQARLLQLLDSGASTEEVAELGVRQNLITPFTSFYVPSEDEVALLERNLPNVRAAGCSYERSAPSMASAPPPPPASVAMSETSGSARAVEGKMGRRDSSRAKNKMFASRGPSKDAPRAEEARPEPEMAEAAPAAPGAAAAPMDAPKASSAMRPMKPMAKKADRAARDEGGMDGDGIGDAFGSSGFGLVGSGSGGGGTGEGTIGLGNLGTIGRGGGSADKKMAKGGKSRRSRIIDDDEAPNTGAEDRRERREREKSALPHGASVDNETTGTLVALNSSDVTVLVGILRHRPRGCSAASTQPLDERRELWRERLSMNSGVRRSMEVFQDASRGCELKRWTDRRELLKLMLRSVGGPGGMVALYKGFDDEPEEQEFLRQAILGEVRSPRDLRVIFDGLGLGDEERALLAQEVVRAAKTPTDRLRRLEDLLRKWPGDLRLRLLRMETEEELGEKESARRTAEEVRRDPYADAQARTAVGELYFRLGDEDAARRAFSEIVEFAPRDSLARRRLGDLYRAHNWFDEAYRQYQTLMTLEPNDQSVLLLLAMAAAGAGHIEEALGLEQRVISTSEPGSETGVSKTALWQTSLRLAQLREEARAKSDAEGLARLFLRTQKAGAMGLAKPLRVLLTWAHPEADLDLRIAAPDETFGPANDLAPQLGFLGWHSHKTASVDGAYQIEVVRRDRPGALKYGGELSVIVHEGEKTEKLWRLPLSFAGSATTARFVLRGGKVEKVETQE